AGLAAMAERVRKLVDLLGGVENILRSACGAVDHRVELIGDARHLWALEAGHVHGRKLALGLADRFVDDVELLLELLRFGDLRLVGLEHPLGHFLGRRRDGAQRADLAQQLGMTERRLPIRPPCRRHAASHRVDAKDLALHVMPPGVELVTRHSSAWRLRLGFADGWLRARDNVRLTMPRRILRAVNYVMMNTAFPDTVKRNGPAHLP